MKSDQPEPGQEAPSRRHTPRLLGPGLLVVVLGSLAAAAFVALGQPGLAGLRLADGPGRPAYPATAVGSPTGRSTRVTGTARPSPELSPGTLSATRPASAVPSAVTTAWFAGAPRLGLDLKPTPTASGTATTVTRIQAVDPQPRRTALPDGNLAARSPFFSWLRPFDASGEVRASRYYPFGTTAGGQYLLHHGVDIGNPMGTTVRAVADGRVVFAGTDDRVPWGPETDFYGRLVVLEHPGALDGQTLYTLYGHVSATLVQAGQSVAAGEPIALVGMEGVAMGPHLHLEVRTAAGNYQTTINPELFLENLPGDGAIVGRLAGPAGVVQGASVSLFAMDGAGAADWLAGASAYPTDDMANGPLGESFVFGDTPAGRYLVSCDLGGNTVSVPVTVTEASAVFVTLRLPGAG